MKATFSKCQMAGCFKFAKWQSMLRAWGKGWGRTSNIMSETQGTVHHLTYNIYMVKNVGGSMLWRCFHSRDQGEWSELRGGWMQTNKRWGTWRKRAPECTQSESLVSLSGQPETEAYCQQTYRKLSKGSKAKYRDRHSFVEAVKDIYFYYKLVGKIT